MDQRIPLKSGSRLKSNDSRNQSAFTIHSEIGRGASCIVYDASYEMAGGLRRTILIREFYPCDIAVIRDADDNLCPSIESEEKFQEGLEKFDRTFAVGCALSNEDGLHNSLNLSMDLFHANHTAYVVVSSLNGETMAQHAFISVRECLQTVNAIARTVGRIHYAGYLYLDLKPQNILMIPETPELVQLFDFDSLYPIGRNEADTESLIPLLDNSVDDFIAQYQDDKRVTIGITPAYAAPELLEENMGHIGTFTDVYALGVMTFQILMGHLPDPADSEIDAVYDFHSGLLAKQTFQDRLYVGLTDFFHHMLASYPPDRYQNMKEVQSALAELLQYADPKDAYIISSEIHRPVDCCGREKEFQTFGQFLNKHKCAYLSGQAGIGKSTFLSEYICRHRDEYDGVVRIYLQRSPREGSDSLRKAILNDSVITISNVRRMPEESDEDYYVRKVSALKEIAASQKILCIVEDYDGSTFAGYTDDSSKALTLRSLDSRKSCKDGDEKTENAFKDFLAIGWQVLLVTRQMKPQPQLPVFCLEPIQDTNALCHIFIKNLGRSISNTELADIEGTVTEICHAVGYNTLAITLLARQIGQGILTIEEAAAFVRKHQLSQLSVGTVTAERDMKLYTDQMGALLTKLLSLNALNQIEKNILREMALLPSEGVTLQEFVSWACFEEVGYDSKRDQFVETSPSSFNGSKRPLYDENVALISASQDGILNNMVDALNRLADLGWILREGNNIRLHALIREVVTSWEWDERSRQAAEHLLDGISKTLVYSWKAYLTLSDTGNVISSTTKSPEKESLTAIDISSYQSIYSADAAYLLRLKDIATFALQSYDYRCRARQKLELHLVRILPQSEEEEILHLCHDLLEHQEFLSNTEIIDAYEEAAYVYNQRNDFERSYTLAQKTKSYVRKIGTPLVRAEYHFRLACELIDSGKMREALRQLTKAEKIAKGMHTDVGDQKLAYYDTREAHWLLQTFSEDYKRIHQKLEEAAAICRRLGLKDIDILSSIASNQALLGARTNASQSEVIANMERASKLMRQMSTSDLFYIENVLLMQMQIYEEMGDYTKANERIHAGIALCENHPLEKPYEREKELLQTFQDDIKQM